MPLTRMPPSVRRRDVPRSHWEWWYTVHGDLLHYLPAMERPGRYERVRDAWPRPALVAACGRRAVYWQPGIFSRIGCRRCRLCCRVLGLASGVGTPLNASLTP